MRENWRVILSGVFTKFLYYVFVSAGRQKKKRKGERDVFFGTYFYTSPGLKFPL